MSMITVNSDYSITLDPAAPEVAVDGPISVSLNPALTSCYIKFDQSVYVDSVLTAANTAIVFDTVAGLPIIKAAPASSYPYDLISTAGAGVDGPWTDNLHPIHVSSGNPGY